MNESKPVFIVGMDRSGTSLVAQMVARWGAYGGDPAELSKGDDRNATGFYEHPKLEQFLGQLLDDILPIQFWDPLFPQELMNRAQQGPWRERALALIAEMREVGRVWFWKEPIMSVMLPFWRHLVGEEITYVVTVRNPYDSARSFEKFLLTKRGREAARGISPCLLRWQFFMRSILAELETADHKHFLAYEDLIADPERVAADLANYLDDSCGLRPESERVEQLAGVVRKDLHRNKEPVAFEAREEASQGMKDLYTHLQLRVDQPQLGYDEAAYPMPAGWRDHLANFNVAVEFYTGTEPLLESLVVQVALLYRVATLNLGEGLRKFWRGFRS